LEITRLAKLWLLRVQRLNGKQRLSGAAWPSAKALAWPRRRFCFEDF
jgi:hypothetical protein